MVMFHEQKTPKVIGNKRHKALLDLLHEEQHLSVTQAAQLLDVSTETIRRDIKSLSGEGLVEKFHGGVQLCSVPVEPPIQRRLATNRNEKRIIAYRTSQLIEDGSTILLDNSSTACFLARELARFEQLTVITFSIAVVQALVQNGAQHRILLPGGEYSFDDSSIVGQSTLEFISQYTPDYFAFSVVAVSETRCGLDLDPFEVDFKRTAMPLAQHRILMADQGKFGASGLIQSCTWSQVDTLISDTNEPPFGKPRLES